MAFLLDTNVVSELRKGERSNPRVRRRFADVERSGAEVFNPFAPD